MMFFKDVRGMDCRNAKEKIELYIDGVLSSAQTEELYSHAEACPDCKKELDNAIRLKNALAALGGLQPPEGLAREACRKASRRRSVPFAYISVAAAAVITLVVVLTSGVLQNADGGSTRNAEESIMMAAPAEGAPQDEMYSMDMAPAAEAPAEEPAATEAPAAMEEPAAEEMAEAPEIQYAMTETEEASYVQDGQPNPKIAGGLGERTPSCIVYVPDELEADIREALEDMIIEYGIEYNGEIETGSMMFMVTEDIAERLTELTADLQIEGSIIEGQAIEFIFNQ